MINQKNINPVIEFLYNIYRLIFKNLEQWNKNYIFMNKTINFFSKILNHYENLNYYYENLKIDNIKNNNTFNSIVNKFLINFNKEKIIYNKLTIYHNNLKSIKKGIDEYIENNKFEIKNYINSLNNYFNKIKNLKNNTNNISEFKLYKNKENKLLENINFNIFKDNYNTLINLINNEHLKFNLILKEIDEFYKIDNNEDNNNLTKFNSKNKKQKNIIKINNYIINEFLKLKNDYFINIIYKYNYFNFENIDDLKELKTNKLNINMDNKKIIITLKLLIGILFWVKDLKIDLKYNLKFDFDIFFIFFEINKHINYFNKKIYLNDNNYKILHNICYNLLNKNILDINNYEWLYFYIKNFSLIIKKKNNKKFCTLFKYLIYCSEFNFWDKIFKIKINLEENLKRKENEFDKIKNKSFIKSLFSSINNVKTNIHKSLLSFTEDNDLEDDINKSTLKYKEYELKYYSKELIDCLFKIEVNLSFIKSIMINLFHKYNLDKNNLINLFILKEYEIKKIISKSNKISIKKNFITFINKKNKINQKLKLYKVFKNLLIFLEPNEIKNILFLDKNCCKFLWNNVYKLWLPKLNNDNFDKFNFWNSFLNKYINNNISVKKSNVNFLNDSILNLIEKDSKRTIKKYNSTDCKSIELILVKLFNYFFKKFNYYQGFNFLISVIFDYLKNEELSYKFGILLVKKLIKYNFLFENKFLILLNIIQKFINKYFRELNDFLIINDIDIKTLIIDHILCLFSNNELNLEFKFQILEYFLIYGLKGIFNILWIGLNRLNQNIIKDKIKINCKDNLIIIIKNLFNSNLFNIKKNELNKNSNYFIKNHYTLNYNKIDLNLIIFCGLKEELNYENFKEELIQEIDYNFN